MSAPSGAPARPAATALRRILASPLRSAGGAALALLVLLAVLSSLFGPATSLGGLLGAWASLVIAISVQAVPFLLLGALVSALLTVFAPQALLRAITPKDPVLAVPVIAASGVLLPGCECASVPVSRSLMRRGIPEPAALAFLLAAPAINPVVIVSTALAYSGEPRMVLARFSASLLAAVLVGWAWILIGGPIAREAEPEGTHPECGRLEALRAHLVADFLDAGGYLVLGAMAAASFKTLLPSSWVEALSSSPVLALASMALLAIILSLCSEADAFVAASFTSAPLSAQLVFLVVGPMIDLKLIAMQRGAWGSAFVRRFAPLVLAAAIGSGALVGAILLRG